MIAWTLNALLATAAAGGLPTDLGAAARTVEAPIAEVTVFGDRARVHRRATVDLAAGTQVLALPDLPGGTWLDTVRVTADGARIVRVETAPVERLRTGIERVESLLDAIEAVDARLAGLDGRTAALQQEIAWLSRITPAPLPSAPEAPRLLVPATWPVVLDFLDARRNAAREAARTLATERRSLMEERNELNRQLRELDLGGITQRRVAVHAVLDAPRARRGVPVEVEYVVPGASWTPVHELHFSAESGEVVLATSGRVRQATGEDWRGVKLALSTATPARGLEMPELLTWALGEARDFVPRPRPRQAIPQPPVHPLPQPKAEPLALAGALRLEEAKARYAAVTSTLVGHAAAEQQAQTRIGGAGMAAPTGGLARHDARVREEAYALDEAEAAPVAYDRAPRPASAPPPARQAARRRSVAESTATFAGASIDGDLVSPTGFLLADPATRRRPPPPPSGSPAALAGGLDFVYPATAPASIPASGEHHNIPLFRERFGADLAYETSPGLMETAFLKATVRNTGERPILGGPTNLFVSGAYAGDGRIQTIGPGGEIALPLGADEDLRIRRVVIPETETTGLLRREEVTVYTHRIEVGNYKRRAVTIRVTDQVPKSRNESVRIEVDAISPSAAEGPTETEGLVHWDLEIPAGETRTVELTYRIRRPVDWQLHQR
jgi:hypothetical protein